MRTLESWGDICVWIRVLGNIQTWKVKKKRKLKSPKKRVENFCFDPPLLFMVDPTLSLSLFFTHSLSLIHISLYSFHCHWRKEGDEFLIFLFSNIWLIKPLPLFFFLFNILFSSSSTLRTILYQDPPLLKQR